ncbi:Uncharacterized protein DBV15_03348 [Temnothorax longispinosus]|uniref:Uncharacterized protein n=1 Tax=Temnothorax longispinosus TaxID=300112 RepID=A0A4V3S7K0_9HYME|nr:Uncharacterized protein DBV15_03348 [Temnothorax longispinosus]
MPPGEQRRTPADVTHPPLHDSQETNSTALSTAEYLVRTLTRATIGNEKATIQSRRLALRAREIARLPRFLDTRTFRLSKWLRHFFHRKEFRRKEHGRHFAAGTICIFRLVGVARRKSELRASYRKQRTPTNYFITNINII